MCVVVALKPSARLTHAEWDKCWTNNPDGAGYAYTRRGKVIVERGLNRAEMWRRYFKDATNNQKSAFVAHFRIATHGNVCLENTHPFPVDHAYKGQTILAHNGIISHVLADLEPNESDTRAFIRLYVKWLPAGWLDNAAIVELVEAFIPGNRIVILTTDPACSKSMYILNESEGKWDGDRWFSNEAWKYGGVITCAFPTARGMPYTPGAWLFDADTKVWSKPVVQKEASDKVSTVVVDTRGIAHKPFLPNGTLPLEGMSEDDLTTLMIAAIDDGYCERCLWKPCWCEGVCFDCTKPLDDCDCGMSLSCAAYYGSNSDSDGMTWLDANPPSKSLALRTPQSRTGDLSEEDWESLERSLTGKKGRWIR